MLHNILVVLLAVPCVMVLLSLIYIVTATRIEDRVVGASLVSTLVLNLNALLAVVLDAPFIVDVGLVFAILDFLAVVVLGRLLAVQEIERTVTEEDIDKAEGGARP